LNNRLLRVTSYNILADSLAELTTSKEEWENNPHLLWENRKKKILTELLTLKSDIICCQEFEKDEKFVEEMGKNGFDMAFKPRTGGHHCEGCAIFWKYDKYVASNLDLMWITCIALN
jgi:mRNA deadenylase 3'-5' endonuclease subunit Ccr4